MSAEGNEVATLSQLKQMLSGGGISGKIEVDDLSISLQLMLGIKTLNDLSWSDILELDINLLKNHIGDEKSVRLFNSYDTNFTLIGIEESSNDLIFQSTNIAFMYQMSTTGSNSGGWGQSHLRQYLNNDLYNSLSQELKNFIKQVNVKYIPTYNSSQLSTCNDYIYILSESEVLGRPHNSIIAENSQYDYYKTNSAKKTFEGSANIYWTRSPYQFYEGEYVGITVQGTSYIYSANKQEGVVPVFHINNK